MYRLTYKIAAMTDVGLVRTNNEDNLYVISNLDQKGSTWKNNEVCDLGERGALMVVADGMGGMNAGEVASEIAVSVVKARFTDDIDSVDLNSDESIVRFMNDTIVIADNTIKREGKRRPDAKGMGTTIVIAWLLGGKLYVSWCGDSRAYIFNPHRGLVQISKDHSYVQDLVDKGIVKPEDAFDFPESNVITRCLSHSSMKAIPDNLSTPRIVGDGDIILLCTDGLCGMIRDNEIADVISYHNDDMGVCAENLIEAAKQASGADNVTVCLCQILSSQGGVVQSAPPINRTNIDAIILGNNNVGDENKDVKKSRNKHTRILAALLTLALLVIVVLLFVLIPKLKNIKHDIDKVEVSEKQEEPKKSSGETVVVGKERDAKKDAESGTNRDLGKEIDAKKKAKQKDMISSLDASKKSKDTTNNSEPQTKPNEKDTSSVTKSVDGKTILNRLGKNEPSKEETKEERNNSTGDKGENE